MADVMTRGKAVSLGNPEMDKKFGGGIPMGSLILIEGASDSGKSVLSQQLTWGTLRAGYRVTVMTTENTVKSLIRQMWSLASKSRTTCCWAVSRYSPSKPPP